VIQDHRQGDELGGEGEEEVFADGAGDSEGGDWGQAISDQEASLAILGKSFGLSDI
jgi:hypothetical protein